MATSATAPKTGTPAGRSCGACPSLLNPAEQTALLGRSFGGSVCSLKLLAIGRPGVDNKHQTHQAKKCDDFGKARQPVRPEAKSTKIELTVALGSVVAEEPNQPERVRSCRDCRHHVSNFEMRGLSGWNSSFCRAKGTLILDDRLERYASGCEDRTFVDPRHAPYSGSITFFPEYTDDFGKVNPASLIRKHKTDSTIDPFIRETDAPVNEKYKKVGIRALRRIVDQKGFGEDLYAPVFDTTMLDPNDLAKVPRSGDDEHPEMYVDHGNYVYTVMALWLKLKETPAVWGKAGVGKTELFRHLAWLMCLPFERLSITASTELDDIAGKMLYRPDQGTFFQYGRVPLAWQKKNVICFDEPNVGPPDVWQFIRPLTDDSKQLVLDQNNGERIKRNQFAYLGMAMNPAWDPKNVGAMQLGDADGSRLMHIKMGLPPEEVEKNIIADRLRQDRWSAENITRVTDMVMRIAPELRALSDDGTIDISWGIRHQIKVARAKRFMSWADAYALGVADALEPSQEQAILDVVRSHCPDEE